MTMPNNDELFDEIFVSSNFTTVFCTQHEVDSYLNSLMISGMPKGMSIVFTKKKLNRKYAKKEIMNAMPEQIKGMIESIGHTMIH
ncbi:MAG TPA: hypothetical protein VFG24_00015 [Nitrosopumilaceae archaeon]|nr:hypothetical protein [Nitrosopumilaceae archaeon]